MSNHNNGQEFQKLIDRLRSLPYKRLLELFSIEDEYEKLIATIRGLNMIDLQILLNEMEYEYDTLVATLEKVGGIEELITRRNEYYKIIDTLKGLSIEEIFKLFIEAKYISQGPIYELPESYLDDINDKADALNYYSSQGSISGPSSLQGVLLFLNYRGASEDPKGRYGYYW